MIATENELLSRTLHTLKVDELKEIRHIADSLFARLTRPFQQTRVDWQFSFAATIKSYAQRGDMLPTYERVLRRQPKSRIVIAMSLSGIDRCYAVGLIPLLAEMKKFLNFRLFIYTDDLIEAEFSPDGYLANDCDLAWNNVLAPVVFSRLADLDIDRQEDNLLIIDSLGGGDSLWYERWSSAKSDKAKEAQKQFMYGAWWEVRDFLGGQFDNFDKIPQRMLPFDWAEKVCNNMKNRWVDTPAMRHYLIRYIFNQRFGRHEHGHHEMGRFTEQKKWWYDEVHISEVLPFVREKFRNIHLLTPALTNQHTFDAIFRDPGYVDFHHKVDSLEGFGQMLVNIVFNRETDRLTMPKIKFSRYVAKEEGTGFVEDEQGGHSELSKTWKDCFAGVDFPEENLPVTQYKFSKRYRGTGYVSQESVPFSEIEGWYGEPITRSFPQWEIHQSWSDFSRLSLARSVLTFISENYFAPSEGYVYLEKRHHDHENDDWDTVQEPNYIRCREQLQPHVKDFFELFPKVYVSYCKKLPLNAVVWCTSAKMRWDKLAISASPAGEPSTQRASIFHEAAHYLEHVCPAIGVFTNYLIRKMCDLPTNKTLQKYVPATNAQHKEPSKRALLDDYAGLWYRRIHPDLPNATEIFSTHMAYFRSPEALVTLLEHDPFMVKHIAFIIMGGPIAMLQAKEVIRNREALLDIARREVKAKSYEDRKAEKAAGGPKKAPERIEKPTASADVEERHSFGI